VPSADGPPGVHGTVAPGFGPVREVFARNFAERDEVGAACAVYLRGQPVVDLWGGLRDRAAGAQWEADTLVLVFSATKGLAAMAMAVAHSRGLFGLDERVAAYWPEFAQGGKDRITVRQLLAHQAGLCAIDTPLRPATLHDLDALAFILARQRPAWEPGTRHGYHALSLGFYESELLRRVDPLHRSLGVYFRDEVARPLGIEFHIGLPANVPAARLAVIEPSRPLKYLLHADRDTWRMVRAYVRPGSLTARAFGNPKVARASDFDGPVFRRLEVPSAVGFGVVRDIAKAYGVFATGGRELGISAATLRELRTLAPLPSSGRLDEVLRADTRFAFGYIKPSPPFRFGSSDAAFGTMGAGGSFAFADPDVGLGFAYAMNRMGFQVWSDPRERALREAVYRCL
jgi:CubicO group peptidase (beta-lactamase class C family)